MTEEKKTTGPGLQKAGTTVKEGIVNSLKGINEIEAEIVSLARNTVSSTLQATGGVAKEGFGVTTDVVKGAIQAAEEVGTGLVMGTKSVAKGIILGVSDVGGYFILKGRERIGLKNKAGKWGRG